MSSAPPAETAFERDVLPHMDLMYRVALRLTGEAAAAEDLVQDLGEEGGGEGGVLQARPAIPPHPEGVQGLGQGPCVQVPRPLPEPPLEEGGRPLHPLGVVHRPGGDQKLEGNPGKVPLLQGHHQAVG